MEKLKIKTQRQPDKQRYLDAVNHIKPEGVPYFEFEVDRSIVSNVLGREPACLHGNIDVEDISFHPGMI